MPQEVTIRSLMQIKLGGVTNINDVTFYLSTNTPPFSNPQVLSTVAEDIDLGEFTWTNVGVIWLKNNSSTAAEIITIVKSGVNMKRIKPGETYSIRPMGDGTAMQAVSASGTPTLLVAAMGAEV